MLDLFIIAGCSAAFLIGLAALFTFLTWYITEKK